MTSPIRVVPLDESFAITGIADYDVEIHVRYRTPDDATETHNYFASIDGMPGYEASGATERGAAEAICGRLIADLTKPPESPGEPSGAVALLAILADRERARHAEKGYKYGGPESVDSNAREEAYRAATHIIRAAKVLAEQPRLGLGESHPPHQLSDAEARASLVASLCKRLPYIAQVRLAGLVCVDLPPDPPVGSRPYPSRAARAYLDGRRRAGRFLLALADDAGAGRMLAAEAWADAALLLEAVFREPAQP